MGRYTNTRILDSPRVSGESSKIERLPGDGRNSQAAVSGWIWVGWKNNRSKEKPNSFSLLLHANVILENKDKPFIVGFSSCFRRKLPQVRAGTSFFFLHWMFSRETGSCTHTLALVYCLQRTILCFLASKNILLKLDNFIQKKEMFYISFKVRLQLPFPGTSVLSEIQTWKMFWKLAPSKNRDSGCPLLDTLSSSAVY